MSNTNTAITNETIKEFLEGRDPQERIVNLDYKYSDSFITVYYRDENDVKCAQRENFYPFVWATRFACTHLCEGNRNELKQMLQRYGIGVKKLSNTNYKGEKVEEFENGYMFMFYAIKPMSYTKFLNFFRTCKNPIYNRKDKNGKTIVSCPEQERQYLIVSPQEQFLISSGKRFFKGYDDYDCLLRMIFDLETEGLDPTKHRIKLNGVKLNRDVTVKGKTYHNWGRIFRLEGTTEEEKNASELKIIDTMLRLIYTFKPDVITAHNGENFDWNFLITRCKMLGTTMEDMSAKYFSGECIRKEEKESVLKLGGEVETFYRTIVPGVIITDSLHAVRRAQATDSNFKKATLKYSTKYLHLKKQNRVYTPGNEIDKVLTDTENIYCFNNTDGDWYRFKADAESDTSRKFKKGKDGDKPFIIYNRNYLAEGYEYVTGQYIIERYLLDDLWECDKVEYTLNGTDFMMSKIIPVSFSKCCTMGTATQWKLIMLAWSYENNLAIPLAPNTGAFTGGLSRLVRVGYVGCDSKINGSQPSVIKLDYNSLYPSIILTWGISDTNDLMQAMLNMLLYVLTTREKYKGLKKKASKVSDTFKNVVNEGKKLTSEEVIEWEEAQNNYKSADNQQLMWKKLGNSFFGSYGSNNGSVFPFKSVKCAEQTTCTGRQCLRLMISHFYNLGYQPIVGDTDGFNFKLPNDNCFRYTTEHPYIGKGLNREVKEGVEYIGFEADVAEFNDMYMKDFHYSENSTNRMGLGIDETLVSSINFSRKNYADYFPENPYPDDVKLVGNTIKSQKMPEYIAIFLSIGIRLLLKNKGQQFIEEYYNYIDKIYNYRIPLRDIASKGKIKKSVEEYKKDIKTITKAGRPKSRQAWYELAIRDNLLVNNGDTVYYINTGKSKSHSDIKKITHYMDMVNGEKVEITKDIDREYKAYKKEEKKPLEKNEWIKMKYPKHTVEEEIVFNCISINSDIIESEKDIYCSEENGIKYNTAKYIDMFNKRITPLLVCFKKEIRDKILINNPEERLYFTEEQCELSSGEPNKVTDQDTYEQLMTMEDKEIAFWNRYNLIPPFVEECGMGTWEEIKADYLKRMNEEKQRGIDKEREKWENVLSKMTKSAKEDIIEDGVIPPNLSKIAVLNEETNEFFSKEFPDVVLGTMNDIIDRLDEYNETPDEI